MPLYEFTCNDCHKDQELLLKIDEPPVCKHCGSQDLVKMLSRFGTPGLSNKTGQITYQAREGVDIGSSPEDHGGHSHSHNHSHSHSHGCNSDFAQKLIEKFDKEKGLG